MSKHRFLICAVGGTPEPVVEALKHWHPERVLFVPSPNTKESVEQDIVPQARQQGVDLDPGRYDYCVIQDEQDLASCLDTLRGITRRVEGWASRGEGYEVVVDFTGGTKCMTAAMVLQARRWPCVFSYIGGGERTKGGIGVVVTGTERLMRQANPWEALGYQAVEEFVVLFDQGAFVAAARVAEQSKKQVGQQDRKREFAALEHLACAFDAWDRFEHRDALSRLEDTRKAGNDLRAVLGEERAVSLLRAIDGFVEWLKRLSNSSPPSRGHVKDLLANACRRNAEGRHDDAVARSYRAIEALAQTRLREHHGFDSTGRVPVERIPEPLRSQWASKAKDGNLMLGLQDAYQLLKALDDPLGGRFYELGLNEKGSLLDSRNSSILAHGFDTVSEDVFDGLLKAALDLGEVNRNELPQFPRLGRQAVREEPK